MVYDPCGEEAGDAGIGAQGLEDREDAGDFVGFEEGGEVGEGGDEDDAGEGGRFAWFGCWRHKVGGQVGGSGVREVEGAGGCHCCAKALAEEDGARGWLVQSCLYIGEERDGIGDEALLGGNMWRIGETRESEATVVASQEVSVGYPRDRAIGRGAVALSDMTCVL